MPFSTEQLRGFAAELREGFKLAKGREPTTNELLCLAGQSAIEASYARGWSGECAASNNWGAIQSLSKSCCWHLDHHPDGTPYHWFYACWPSRVEGAAGFVREVFRRSGVPEAEAAGDIGRAAERLHATSYYDGICKPYEPGSEDCRRHVVRNYAGGMHREAAKMAAALGVPALPLGSVPPPPGEPPSSGGGTGGTVGALAFGGLALAGAGLLALTLRRR